MLLTAAAQADDSVNRSEALAAARQLEADDIAALVSTPAAIPVAAWAEAADTSAASPLDVDVAMVLAAIMPTDARDEGPPIAQRAARDSPSRPVDADSDAPWSHAALWTGDTAERPSRLQLRLHAADAATASGFADTRIRTLSLALDAVLPRSGVTLQPRLQLAYQPRDDGLPNPALAAMPADAGSTGIALRLYGAQPTRLAGVYPFVEADWWQDSRKQTININGTRIDTDLLRGILSFNVGAHGSTRSGIKVWVKVKTGRNAGGIIGARYRW